jgi:CubicO group peptidase (beta-lactamase class C family)
LAVTPTADVERRKTVANRTDRIAGDGTPRLRPARGAITLRQLLTHSSGFVYDTWNADMAR